MHLTCTFCTWQNSSSCLLASTRRRLSSNAGNIVDQVLKLILQKSSPKKFDPDMRHLSIPPSYDLPVARTLKEAEKSKLFFLKKEKKCSLHGWHQCVSSAWLWEGTRTLNIAEKNSAILGVLGPN